MLRRRFLLAGALTVGVATAGCLDCGDGGSGTTSPDETDSVSPGTTDRSAPTESAAAGSGLELLDDATGGAAAQRIGALRSGFEAAHPDVSLDVRSVADADATRVAADRIEADVPPGAFLTPLGEALQPFAGDLLDIGNSVWEASTRRAHVGAVRDLCRVGDRLVGVPTGTHRVNELFYRPSILASAGVDAENVDSVDGLLAACDRVESDTDATPFVQASEATWPTTQLLATALLSRGGPAAVGRWIGDGDATDALEQAVADVRSLLATADDSAPIRNHVETTTAFADGGVAFLQQGSWVGQHLHDGSEFGTDWDRIAFPGTADSYVVEPEGFVAPVGGPDTEDARRWLQFLASGDGQRAVTSAGWAVATRSDVDADVYAGYQRGLFDDLRDAGDVLPSITHGRAITPAASDAVETAVETHVLGERDAAEAADALVAAIDGS